MHVLHRTSFDEGFPPYEGEEHLLVPTGWHPIWTPGDKPGPVRPEIQPEIRSRGDRGILTGEHGLKLCHAFSFFDGAVYKDFASIPGRLYRAIVYATAESDGGLACRIGIGPPNIAWEDAINARDTDWSQWYGTDDAHFGPYLWQSIAVEHIAAGDDVRVYLRCACRDAVQVNAGFLDDFILYGDEPTAPPPSPDQGLMWHIDQLAAAVDLLAGDISALAAYVGSQARSCLLLD